MDKNICKELRVVEKRLNIPLGNDIHNEILGFLLPSKVGDIWKHHQYSIYFMVTRCTPDKVWLKEILRDGRARGAATRTEF